MKHTSLLPLVFLSASALLASCSKEATGVDIPETSEIVLAVDDGSMDMNVETKATAITAVPSSLYWEGTTGTWKSETAKWSSASASVSSGKLNTGKYQTATATAYNYYLANSAITFASGGSTISASNATDVIAGCTQAATTSTAPSITLDHVFARTGTLTCNTQSGYTISGVSWKIQSKSGGTGGTAGTYNIATKGWSGVTALAQTAVTSSSDMYLTPGAYTITVSYTLTKGDWKGTFTKSGDVTLVAGKVNSITCNASGGAASEIVLGVTLTAWGTQALTLTLS